MTAPHADQLIADYLARLRGAAADLPRTVRDELMEDMRTHIAEARAHGTTDESDATILNILDRLGEPAGVVADARERLGIRPRESLRPGLMEIGAIVLLPVIWPIGAVFLWSSRAWTIRDKIVASLIPPGGAFGLALLAITAHSAHLIIQGTGPLPAFLVHLGPLPFLLVTFFAPVYLFIQLHLWRDNIAPTSRRLSDQPD